MPCSGYPDERCGGHTKLTVYAITGEGSPREDTSYSSHTEDEEGDGAGASSSLSAADSDEADSSGDGYSYMGCFTDVRHARSLRSHTMSSDTMTPPVCKAFCEERGNELFGLQYGRE